MGGGSISSGGNEVRKCDIEILEFNLMGNPGGSTLRNTCFEPFGVGNGWGGWHTYHLVDTLGVSVIISIVVWETVGGHRL